MPSSISMPTTSMSWRRSRSCRANATSNRLWLPTPTTRSPARRRVQRPPEQRLVAGVDLGLGFVRRGLPSAELGVDVLHRQVGTLDQADLDVAATLLTARRRPLDELVEHGVGVGKVGLQHEARGEAGEFRFVEHPAERLDRQLEVAVLLHVEVDEDRWVALQGHRIDRAAGRRSVRPRGRTPARRGWRTTPRSSPRRSRRRRVASGRTAASSRRLASASPRIASPRRLMFTANPASRRAATCRANAGSAAGMMTPRVSARIRLRTTAATGPGATRAPIAASRNAARSTAGSAGGARRRRALATAASSGWPSESGAPHR